MDFNGTLASAVSVVFSLDADTVETFLCELRSVCVACFSLVAGFLGVSVVDLAGLPVPILWVKLGPSPQDVRIVLQIVLQCHQSIGADAGQAIKFRQLQNLDASYHLHATNHGIVDANVVVVVSNGCSTQCRRSRGQGTCGIDGAAVATVSRSCAMVSVCLLVVNMVVVVDVVLDSLGVHHVTLLQQPVQFEFVKPRQQQIDIVFGDFGFKR